MSNPNLQRIEAESKAVDNSAKSVSKYDILVLQTNIEIAKQLNRIADKLENETSGQDMLNGMEAILERKHLREKKYSQFLFSCDQALTDEERAEVNDHLQKLLAEKNQDQGGIETQAEKPDIDLGNDTDKEVAEEYIDESDDETLDSTDDLMEIADKNAKLQENMFVEEEKKPVAKKATAKRASQKRKQK